MSTPRKPAAGTDLDDELRFAYLIHDVSRLRRSMFDRWLSPHGITRSQWWVLAFLTRQDGLPQSELAHELDVGKVALGALIDRLEVAGLVRRRADKKDRRVKRIFLTPRANGLLKTVWRANKDFNDQVLSGIPMKNLHVAGATLDKLKQNLLASIHGDTDAMGPQD
ncbi:Transcriptional regulator SlyA [Marinovum algicola]|uniref:DNA-binding transcriptional regulator, MarR family n=1 Tax=Marinovum algicola TaxID=42444 RepID=A0A975WBW6_9RHOB|nr:MarR family winged helix-turn-helix transcriptional regulator [Marinovum algicola]SEJ83004.1 DNA-binding transcriptional regulator, MarR family [Marinovum algicola]SLN62618.1 Transcriptional regulator SlyA [Marinovum algicola]